MGLAAASFAQCFCLPGKAHWKQSSLSLQHCILARKTSSLQQLPRMVYRFLAEIEEMGRNVVASKRVLVAHQDC